MHEHLYWSFFFCEIMNGITSIVRALNSTNSNLNDVSIYQGLISIIDYYNTLAKSKGLPIKQIPVYDKRMNTVLIKRFIRGIIKDIE